MVCNKHFVFGVSMEEGLDDIPENFDSEGGIENECASVPASIVVTEVADQALKRFLVNIPNPQFSNIHDRYMVFYLAR